MNASNLDFSYKKIFNNNLYSFYHENTSLDNYNSHLFIKNINYAVNNYDIYNKNKQDYNNFEGIKVNLYLPSKNNDESISLYKSILNRRSTRKFKNKSLSFNDFSEILFYSLGCITQFTYNSIKCNSYAYPSAGGIDSLRFIIIVQNVEQIEKGVYCYDHDKHCLIKIMDELDNGYKSLTLSCELTENIAFSVHVLGSMKIKGIKYGDKAYRYINIEAGHAAQNLYLTSISKKLGVISSGGMLDGCLDKFSCVFEDDLLGLYEIFIGYPDGNDL